MDVIFSAFKKALFFSHDDDGAATMSMTTTTTMAVVVMVSTVVLMVLVGRLLVGLVGSRHKVVTNSQKVLPSGGYTYPPKSKLGLIRIAKLFMTEQPSEYLFQ